MKTVYAETEEQVQKISHLVEYIYTSIFPNFFSDEEIYAFKQMNFLNVLNKNQLTGTLKESYQIISCLELLIFTIESNQLNEKKYQQLFLKNADILTEIGMAFPFSYESFMKAHNIDSISEFRPAANKWLV